VPEIVDHAPDAAGITDYDRDHRLTYLRLLDAAAAGASWEEVAEVLLEADPRRDRAQALARYESHARRARWMAEEGYLQLLRASRA
jgi:hypothetical protein